MSFLMPKCGWLILHEMETKITDLHSLPMLIKINFAEDTMCGRKLWKKLIAMYWFAYKAYSRVIRGWTQVCMKWLEN